MSNRYQKEDESSFPGIISERMKSCSLREEKDEKKRHQIQFMEAQIEKARKEEREAGNKRYKGLEEITLETIQHMMKFRRDLETERKLRENCICSGQKNVKK